MMKLIHKQLQTIAPWIPGILIEAGARVSTFVQAIQGRYLGRAYLWPRIEAILKISPMNRPGVTLHTTNHYSWIRPAARLDLKLVTVGGQATNTYVAEPKQQNSFLSESTPGIHPAWRLARQPLVAQRVLSSVQRRQVQTQEMIYTYTKRSTGVASAAELASGGTASQQPPMTRPVQQVFRRSLPIGRPPGESKPTIESGTLPFQVRPALRRQDTSNPPQIDINQLTEQVVQAIDRRALAYRERLGRV